MTTAETPSYTAMEAALRGHDTFLSLKPCKWGHKPPRRCRKDSGACVECYEVRKANKVNQLKFGVEASSACEQALKAVFARAGRQAEVAAVEAALVRVVELVGAGRMSAESLTCLVEAFGSTGL